MSVKSAWSESFASGVCVVCKQFCEANKPDACLGEIPGVSHACCGHEEVEAAYVVLGGKPDQNYQEIPHAVTLRGADARTFFALVRASDEVGRFGKQDA